MGVGWYGCGCGEVGVGGCGVVGVVYWVWGGGCGCRCGHGESNSCTKHYILRAIDYIISSLFVQSVIFCHSLCGLLNKLVGCGEVCVGVVVRSCGCGCEELWVWGGAFEEVGVGRWVWGGGCG